MFARKFLIVSMIAFGSTLLVAKSETKKVVFSCKSGETSQFIRLLDHVTHLEGYYMQHHIPYSIAIVAQSECVKFMLSDLDGTRWATEEVPFDAELKLDKLKNKVRFEQCENTLDKMGINKKKLREHVKLIPSATVQLVDYQLDGYAIMNQ